MTKEWRFYRGIARDKSMPELPRGPEIPKGHPLHGLPDAPSWRRFDLTDRDQRRGLVFRPPPGLVDVVNMAIYLRRPLLITGRPGTGKSTLAWSIAEELQLEFLQWPITTRTTLQEGLYTYDVIRRLQDVQIYERAKSDRQNKTILKPAFDPVTEIGEYLTLGPLGMAMLPPASGKPPTPRVLLIDEIDKSDIDLPNDLLHIFEEGAFELREVSRHQRLAGQEQVQVRTPKGDYVNVPGDGTVCCTVFPIIIMTSNKERDFPPAFLRRCLRYEIREPKEAELADIVTAHLGAEIVAEQVDRIRGFAAEQVHQNLATDQLLNLLYLLRRDVTDGTDDPAQVERMAAILLKNLEAGS